MLSISEMYESGMSIPQIAAELKSNRSRIRTDLLKAGVKLRSAADGIRLAKPRLGSGHRGKTRTFTEGHKAALKASAIRRGELTAVGFSLKPNGYFEHTRGEHKGRLVHDVIMEKIIGRRLLPGECVHHKDENKQNNSVDNLRLMTRSDHTKLHRTELRKIPCPT